MELECLHIACVCPLSLLQAEQPYLARSRTFKEEMSITTKLEEKIESRDHDILDLKRNLRAKVGNIFLLINFHFFSYWRS